MPQALSGLIYSAVMRGYQQKYLCCRMVSLAFKKYTVGYILVNTRRLAGKNWLLVSDCGIGRCACADSAGTQQAVGVEQCVDDVGILVEAAADGGGDRLAGFPAQAGALGQLDADAAHGAHFAGAGRDPQVDAEQRLHAFGNFFQLGVAGDGFDAGDQFFLFVPRQPEYAQIALRVGQQRVALAHAGAGRAFCANREGRAPGSMGSHSGWRVVGSAGAESASLLKVSVAHGPCQTRGLFPSGAVIPL